MTNPDKFLLLDSNVLSDYMRVSDQVLRQTVRTVGQIYVPSTIVDECRDIDYSDCERLGLIVVEPTFGQVAEASVRRGGLSFQDKICFLICKEEGFVCVTNDKSLQKACKKAGVSTLWGLQLLLELAKTGEMPTAEARSIAQEIQKSNPGFISQKILGEFMEKLGNIKFDEH